MHRVRWAGTEVSGGCSRYKKQLTSCFEDMLLGVLTMARLAAKFSTRTLSS